MEGNNLFSGGFLGLDNIGVFDRSKPLPTGGYLQQADGTAWMAFYCLTMLSMALELAQTNPAYEDMASKFFEHFIHISDAMNSLGEEGLWDEEDGFYYDELKTPRQRQIPLKTRSLVGLMPLIAVEILESEQLERLPGFTKRMNWFLNYRPDLAPLISLGKLGRARTASHALHRQPGSARTRSCVTCSMKRNFFRLSACVRSRRFIAIIPTFSRRGTRSIASIMFRARATATSSAATRTGAARSGFRSIISSSKRWSAITISYGDEMRVECPRGSGTMLNLKEVAAELSRRAWAVSFCATKTANVPFAGGDPRFAHDPHWRDLVLFHEYFHGDNGRGLGASHQTGWTALAARLLEGMLPNLPRPDEEPRMRAALLASVFSLAVLAGALSGRAEVYQSPRAGKIALPPAARAQSGRLVSVGRGGFRESAEREQADLPLRRLFHLPLVPRDGARELRERGDRAVAERQFCQHQSRSRRAARHRRRLHDVCAGYDRQRRLADERLAHAGAEAHSSAARIFRRRKSGATRLEKRAAPRSRRRGKRIARGSWRARRKSSSQLQERRRATRRR